MIPDKPLTNAQKAAAELVALDTKLDRDIAAEIGVTKITLERWKRLSAFQTHVAAVAEAQRAAIRAEGIANKQNRIDAYNDRWSKLTAIIEARAASPTPSETNGERGSSDDDDDGPIERLPVPGWETGLLVKVVRTMGKAVEIRYEVDGVILKELRDHEKQAAQELGQWVEKSESRNEHAILGLIGINVADL
jgi:hypothetical protein